MLLSTFELLIKKNVPPSESHPTHRILAKGYFLTVVNLNMIRDIGFYLQFTIPRAPFNPDDRLGVDRDFTREVLNNHPGNHIVISDANGRITHSQLSGGSGDAPFKQYKTQTITITKGQTVHVQIFPNTDPISLFGSVFQYNFDWHLVARHRMELRGFVEIFQAYPYTETPIPINYNFPSTDLLATAESRGTFTDLLGTIGSYNTISYPLPLASGQSRLTLPGISTNLGGRIINFIREIQDSFRIRRPKI